MNSSSLLEYQGLAVEFLIKARNEDSNEFLLKQAQSLNKKNPGNQISWYDTFEILEIQRNPNSPLNYGFVQDCTDDNNMFVISDDQKKLQEAYNSRKQELEKQLHEHELLM